MLFNVPAIGLFEQRQENSRTISERCGKAASLVNDDKQAIIWCNLNIEGNLLERLIPDAVQVQGSDSPEKKEEYLLAFAEGSLRVLITKPKIGAWGLNFQKCAHVVFFPSHSYEQYYQAIRRCWRFGQIRPVQVDIILSEGNQSIMANLARKAEQADKMFSELVAEMNHAVSIDKSVSFQKQEEIPSWL